jgi:hypothetical protein
MLGALANRETADYDDTCQEESKPQNHTDKNRAEEAFRRKSQRHGIRFQISIKRPLTYFIAKQLLRTS